MTDLQSTLDAIDTLAVHQCGQCDRALPDGSVSAYWCDDVCQEAWNAARGESLVGYREPYDLPVHINNQVEEFNPETTPRREVMISYHTTSPALPRRFVAPESGFYAFGFGAAFAGLSQAMEAANRAVEGFSRTWVERMEEFGRGEMQARLLVHDPEALMRLFQGLPIEDEVAGGQTAESVRDRALRLRRERSTGPAVSRRAPRRIDARRNRG